MQNNNSTKNFRIMSVCENPILGDIDGNINIARNYISKAIENNINILVFSEMFVLGYPAEDLVKKPAAVLDCKIALENFAKGLPDDLAVIIGTPYSENNKTYNAVAVLLNKKIEAVRFKHELPNYDVFDEKRVFDAGENFMPVEIFGVKFALPICEDIWFKDVCDFYQNNGAEFIISPNGSPYRRGVIDKRVKNISERNSETKLPLIYVNQLGGQDELCFDGSAYIGFNSKIYYHIAQFTAGFAISEWSIESKTIKLLHCDENSIMPALEQDYSAAVLALRDYINKNRFPGVLLGLSGGIDSAISAAMAVDALGKDRVICVMMPSIYTSGESHTDAKECADLLGVKYENISIANIVQSFETELAPSFANKPRDLTEENLQSRARGVILMALSNKFGHMVLTTGNKSEMAVGYATLYGDMCGGYNCLKDFYKTEVFKLTEWRNENKPLIGFGPSGIVVPQNIITKPPSAELRENQKDQDSLPPYDILDDILYGFVELEDEIEDVIARGHDPKTVQKIQNLLYLAEYKRRQSPPGVKISQKNFGRDRRYPITNRYRDKI